MTVPISIILFNGSNKDTIIIIIVIIVIIIITIIIIIIIIIIPRVQYILLCEKGSQ